MNELHFYFCPLLFFAILFVKEVFGISFIPTTAASNETPLSATLLPPQGFSIDSYVMTY
jgi:hypothetical protein